MIEYKGYTAVFEHDEKEDILGAWVIETRDQILQDDERSGPISCRVSIAPRQRWWRSTPPESTGGGAW